MEAFFPSNIIPNSTIMYNQDGGQIHWKEELRFIAPKYNMGLWKGIKSLLRKINGLPKQPHKTILKLYFISKI